MKNKHIVNSLRDFLFFVFIVLINLNINAQAKWDTEERIYQDGVLLTGLIDIDKMEIEILQPVGKKVKIIYDPFYEKYTIDWEEQDGPSRMILTKSGIAGNGSTTFVDSYAPVGKQAEFFVHNNISTVRKLTLVTVLPFLIEKKNYKMIFVFDDLK